MDPVRPQGYQSVVMAGVGLRAVGKNSRVERGIDLVPGVIAQLCLMAEFRTY